MLEIFQFKEEFLAITSKSATFYPKRELYITRS